MSSAPKANRGVAAVVLAAGESRRFGSPKQQALLNGRTLVQHVIQLAVKACLDPVIAVVPAWFDPPQGGGLEVDWVRNSHPERGMSESLKLGFVALPAGIEAAVILLGDQPSLPASSIAAIVARRGERPIVAAQSRDHPTPPVLVERSHFGVVQQATGDRGLHDLLVARPEWVTAVDLPPIEDVDTPDQLRALESPR
jgi:molybdenum cofactor cytidylyltransferase